MFVTAVAAEGRPTANSLLKSIETRGASSVLRALWSDQSKFEYVCSKIESGKGPWLDVAVKLKAVSDAASSLSLDYSVARAIPNAPEAVLELVGPQFSLESICTTPFIEPEAGVAQVYSTKAIAALGSVTNDKLQPIAKKCSLLIRDGIR
jgi:hypothetical protein